LADLSPAITAVTISSAAFTAYLPMDWPPLGFAFHAISPLMPPRIESE